ncbi:hypothetical protein [Campylobacter majalis]|nr:hypothetical protein [Campylobacter majalis]
MAKAVKISDMHEINELSFIIIDKDRASLCKYAQQDRFASALSIKKC